MWIPFYKYHGTGNDFIIVDKLKNQDIELNESIIKNLCNRRYGIGSDGLMVLLSSVKYDFQMEYFNSDGKEGSMCGNGGRCIVSYAKMQKIIKTETSFLAIDGVHNAFINNNIVKLKMNDVNEIIEYTDGFFLDTGSPHFVKLTNDIKCIDIEVLGKKLRNDKRFAPKGANVNFVEENSKNIYCTTYERGVEKETHSCGTGAVATAIALKYKSPAGSYLSELITKGGKLKVYFTKSDKNFVDIWLEGETEFVFEGKIKV